MQQCFIAGILCLSLSLLFHLVVVAVSTIDYALVISVANVVVFTPFWAFSASSIKINTKYILKGNLAKSSTGLLSSGSFPVPPGPTPCCFCCCFLSALLYDYLLHNNKRKMNQKMSELVEREKGAKSQWNIEKFIGNKANRVFKLLIWECFPKQKNMH